MAERRHRTLVDKFQYKLIIRMVVYAAVYQFTLWNFMFFWRVAVSGGGGNFVQQYGQFSREFAPMLFCMLTLLPALVWDAVRFYHRIAGPLVQFRKAITDVADGRPVGYVRLRAEDELGEFQDDFNDMLDALSGSGAVTLTHQTGVSVPNEPKKPGDNSPNTADKGISYVLD